MAARTPETPTQKVAWRPVQVSQALGHRVRGRRDDFSEKYTYFADFAEK